MSFAVVHMMKIGKGGLRGIQSHNQREKEPRSNPDIDKERSCLNYDLLNKIPINYHREVSERIARLAPSTQTVRKDAVVLCNFIVSSDTAFFAALSPEIQRSFFQDSVRFFSERYGARTIVNATIHMDEKTPHMHLGLVPIKEDRLTAKALFDRKELQSLQTDFARVVGLSYGLERGVEGSERKHLSEMQFKAAMAEGEVAKAQQGLEAIQNEKRQVAKQIDAMKALRGAVVPVREKSAGFGQARRVVEVTMDKATYDACVSAQHRADHAEMRARDAEMRAIKMERSSGMDENIKLLNKVKTLQHENALMRTELTKERATISNVKKILDADRQLTELFRKTERRLLDNERMTAASHDGLER